MRSDTTSYILLILFIDRWKDEDMDTHCATHGTAGRPAVRCVVCCGVALGVRVWVGVAVGDRKPVSKDMTPASQPAPVYHSQLEQKNRKKKNDQ